MESKALEKLGILRPKRTFGGIVIGFVRKIVVLGIIGLCAWGGIRLWMNRDVSSVGNEFVKSVPIKTADDGNLYICEHLSVAEVSKLDIETEERNGRIVASVRQYWFRLGIDATWYFRKFIPRVKKYLAEIAPDAITEVIALDTKDLAYSNDGADKLNRQCGGSIGSVDRFDWLHTDDASRGIGYPKRKGYKPNEINVMLIDDIKSNGSITLAKMYTLTRPEYDKLQNWVSENVLRDRVRLSATMIGDGLEVGRGEWRTDNIVPISSVVFRCSRCYAISPWVDVSSGARYQFLGIRCRNVNGLPDNVKAQWNL